MDVVSIWEIPAALGNIFYYFFSISIWNFFYFLGFLSKFTWGVGHGSGISIYWSSMSKTVINTNLLASWSTAAESVLLELAKTAIKLVSLLNATPGAGCAATCDCRSYITANIAPGVPNLNPGEHHMEMWCEQHPLIFPSICVLLWSIYKKNNLCLST